jgi:predicted N-acetyltransferase YhbS
VKKLKTISLSKSLDRKRFDCGQDDLNNYLQRTARQHQEKGLSKTWVVTNKDEPEIIIGYYTLSLSEINLTDLNPNDAKRFPNAKLPVAKLARLAVDKNKQGLSIGRQLIADAIIRTRNILDDFAIVAMVVDAKDKQASSYYQQFGFIPLDINPLKLYLPVKTLLKIPLE